jgi:hypothetical protein
MQIRYLFCLSLFLFAGINLFAEPDFVGATKDLSKIKRTHPYLLFDSAGKQAILTRIQSNQEEQEIFEKIKWEGKKYLYAPDDQKVPEKNIHTRFFGEDEYRKYQSWQSDGALTLAFLYQMTGDEEYADRLCALDSWINRAHYFEIIYPRVWPYNVKDDQVVFSLDITSSQYAQKLAIVYDWIYPAVTKSQHDRIRGALLEKVITLVRGSYEYHWWATAYKCNWSAICHSAIGMTALALLNEDPQLTDVIAKSYEGVWNVYENFGENGGWQEGRGYWSFAMDQSIYFDEALKRITSGEVNLFKHKKIYRYPCDFALFGLTAGFGDGGGEPVGNSAVINKLIAETGSTSAAYYRQKFIKSSDGIFDLIWPVPNVEPKEPTEFSKHFKGIDWVMMRKNFDPSTLTIACKAGMNDDPHHGHLDCGTFNLSWLGQYFIGEMKGSGYDERYFGELRWEYPKASSRGHNLVIVNGEEQVEAKYKDQPWKEGVGGKILEFQTNKTWDYVKIDPTNAYPGKEFKHWIRWIILDKENNFALVFDKINCAKGAEIEVRFQPGVDFMLKNQQVVLKGEKGELDMVPVSNSSYQIKKGRIPKMSLKKDDPFAWYEYFSTVTKAKSGDNYTGNIFIPTSGGKAKVELSEANGHQIISCELDGKEVKYEISENSVNRIYK